MLRSDSSLGTNIIRNSSSKSQLLHRGDLFRRAAADLRHNAAAHVAGAEAERAVPAGARGAAARRRRVRRARGAAARTARRAARHHHAAVRPQDETAQYVLSYVSIYTIVRTIIHFIKQWVNDLTEILSITEVEKKYRGSVRFRLVLTGLSSR